MPPTISVIIPVYNGTNYLRQAIDSVLAQTYTDYEIVVVDDGSTDGTWELIESYGARVRGIRQANGGTAKAMNCGIQAARGEFIAWLSHDDEFLPTKLERNMAVIATQPGSAGCYCDYYLVDGQDRLLREMKMPSYPPAEMIRHLLQWEFIYGCALLIKRACFEQEGYFDPQLRYVHDGDMWFRILRHYTLIYQPETLVKFRVHPLQGSQKVFKIRADHHEWWRRCLEDYPLTDIFPELIGRENDLPAIARAHVCLGDIMRICHADMSLARGAYLRGLRAWNSLKNPAWQRAITGQLFFPELNWVIRKIRPTLVRFGWFAQPGDLINQRDEPILASNLVPCPRF